MLSSSDLRDWCTVIRQVHRHLHCGSGGWVCNRLGKECQASVIPGVRGHTGQGCYWGIKWLHVHESRQSLDVLHVHTITIHHHSCCLKAGHKGQAWQFSTLMPPSASCRLGSVVQLLQTELLRLKIPRSELTVNRFCCQHSQAPKYLTDYCLPLSWTAASLFCHSTSSGHIMSNSQHTQLPGPDPMSETPYRTICRMQTCFQPTSTTNRLDMLRRCALNGLLYILLTDIMDIFKLEQHHPVHSSSRRSAIG